MAVKKQFPYRAAVVACNGGCRSAEGEAGCADGCIGCKACIDKCKFGAISINEYGVAEVEMCIRDRSDVWCKRKHGPDYCM